MNDVAAFLVTGASLLMSALLLGLWRVSGGSGGNFGSPATRQPRERFLLLASIAQAVFAVHQLPLFFEPAIFDVWFVRGVFAGLFGVYVGLTLLVANLLGGRWLGGTLSRGLFKVTKFYVWLVLPASLFVFGVYDFTGYVSSVYAHHRLTANNVIALGVNVLLVFVLVRKFWFMQAALLQSRLDAGFAAERAQLLERQRIMQDIHDTVGSQLVGLLAMAQNHAPYADLAVQTAEALQELRIAVDAIQPVNGNLAAVLATLRHRLQPKLAAAGLTLIWQVDDLPRLERLEPQTVQHIQRIVMEALSNVMQHARASEVTLSARYVETHSCIEICIHDNGIGFDAVTPRTAGQGWANLQFRAQAIRADLTFEAPSRVVLRLCC
jgi:signal transduction histidine kinase